MAFAMEHLLVAGLLLGPMWRQPWWRGFGRYFANDQPPCAAIASNVSVGELGLVEPFTLTSSPFYLSLWDQVMGIVAVVTACRSIC